GQLTSRRFAGTGQTPVRFDFAYSSRGELTTLTRFSDVAGSNGVGTTVYSHDDDGKVTSIVNKDNANATLSYYSYGYDSKDRVTSHSWSSAIGTTTYSGTRSYSYDATDQLTNDGTTTYAYDANGNRTMAGYQTGTANRMTNDGVFTYSYDDEG